MNTNDDFDDDLPEKPSKTAVKKEMTALQELGEHLVELGEADLARMPIDERLQEAIRQARNMKQRSARRRQLQYIGRLMREVDNADEIREAYESTQQQGREATQLHHLTERWRADLLEPDTANQALQNFVSEYPHTEIQQLRQIIRSAQQDQATGKNRGHSKKLFQVLRETIQNN